MLVSTCAGPAFLPDELAYIIKVTVFVVTVLVHLFPRRSVNTVFPGLTGTCLIITFLPELLATLLVHLLADDTFYCRLPHLKKTDSKYIKKSGRGDLFIFGFLPS